MKFELLAGEHSGYENWLHNHYTQLVFDPEEGLLDFVTITPGRCLLIERMEQEYGILEKEGIHLGDYIRYYLAKGYLVSRATDDPEAKGWREAFDDIWICRWLEEEGVFACLRHAGNAELELCHVSEEELSSIIRGWNCRIAFEKARLDQPCVWNQERITRNIEHYVTSKPLPGPDGYYGVQKENATYGMDAGLAFVNYYQEEPTRKDGEIREKVRASLQVLIEQKELMEKRLTVLQEKTAIAISADFMQEYRAIRTELEEIAKALFARKAECWNREDRELIDRIRELITKEKECFQQLRWITGR